MKTLTDYVNDRYLIEGLDSEDAQVFLQEGILGGLGKLMGWGANKVRNAASSFSDGFNKAFNTGVVAANKSKDEEAKKDAKELADELKDKTDDKGALEVLKTRAETLLKTISKFSSPMWPISVKRQLKNLSTELNDEEGLELAEKLQKAIDKKWKEDEVDKSEETIKKTEEKVEKATEKAIKNGEGKEKEGKDGEGKEEGKDGESKDGDKKEDKGASKEEKKAKKEVKNAVTDEIKDNSDLLGPLAKAAKIDGNELRNFVSNKMTYQLISKSTKKDGSAAKKAMKLSNVEEYTAGDDFKNDVLGMCVVVCGALISGNPEKFMKICEVLNISEASTADGLRKKIKQFNIDQAKAAKSKADKAKSSEDSKKEEKK